MRSLRGSRPFVTPLVTPFVLVMVCLCAGICCALMPQVAHAALIPVDTSDYGENADGKCSLLEAILAANANLATGGCPTGDSSVRDLIVLAAGATYSLPTSFGDYDGLTALPTITSSVTISGNGAIIERSGEEGARHFHVAGPTGDLRLEDLTLRNGYALSNGGAVANQGTLTVVNSRIVSNTAQGSGGGIYSAFESVVTITNSDILSNTATQGGGIFTSGNLTGTIANSTIAYNRASEDGGGLHLDFGSNINLYYTIAGTYEYAP